MQEQWEIFLYSTPLGNTPVKDFIDGLDIKAQAKIRNTIALLREFGISLGLPHVKKVTGTSLWELRILGEHSIRIFYIAHIGRSFLLVHGFQKKQNRTPAKEIAIAEKRLKELKTRT